MVKTVENNHYYINACPHFLGIVIRWRFSVSVPLSQWWLWAFKMWTQNFCLGLWRWFKGLKHMCSVLMAQVWFLLPPGFEATTRSSPLHWHHQPLEHLVWSPNKKPLYRDYLSNEDKHLFFFLSIGGGVGAQQFSGAIPGSVLKSGPWQYSGDHVWYRKSNWAHLHINKHLTSCTICSVPGSPYKLDF